MKRPVLTIFAALVVLLVTCERVEKHTEAAKAAMQELLANAKSKIVDMPFDGLIQSAVLMGDLLLTELDKTEERWKQD